jgi:hypothetical protein
MPHAPGHLRGDFVDWLEEGMPHEVAAEGPEHFFYDGVPDPLVGCSAQLWRCSDVTGALCDELDLPRGSTYAAAVQGFAASLSGGSSDAGRG